MPHIHEPDRASPLSRGLPRLRGIRWSRGSSRALLVLATLAMLAIQVDVALALGSRPGGRASYGPALGADALNNSIVGGRYAQKVAYRFRATTTSRLESIRINIVTGSGYSSGNRGTLRITVRPSVNRHGQVPSSRVLATRTVHQPGFSPGVEFRFASPPRLVKGRIYHVVFENVDPNPRRNYVSLNSLFMFGRRVSQPAFRDSDWAHLVRREGQGWGPYPTGTNTPIMGLKYENGHRSGLGYMEVWVHSRVRISGERRVRQVFTVKGRSRRVTEVSVRLKRLGGDGPLSVVLLRGDDVVAGGRIPASRIARSAGDDLGGSTWATLRFGESVRLLHGEHYRLVLSSPSGTEYSIVGIRQGSSYGYHGATWFGEGRAERDGSGGWRPFEGWGRPSVEADLQFYFR